MTALRRILIFVSIIGALAIVVTLKIEGRRLEFEWTALTVLVGALFVGNLAYLLQTAPPAQSRFGRIFRLWLDAKEQDLSSRARSRGNESSAERRGKN